MIIATNLAPAPRLPSAFTPGQAAFFCARMIEGMARGCVPPVLSGHWRLPPLYQSGVRYRPEPSYGTGFEDFALPITTQIRGWADCDDATIRRLVELYVAGEDAQCRCEWVGNRMHVYIHRAPGRRFVLLHDVSGPYEDPAIQIGAVNP